MRFGNPEYFFLLLLIPLFIGFFMWAHQYRKAALERFASQDLIKKLTPGSNLSRLIWRRTFFLLFLFFMILALVRPRFGVKTEMVERRGVDVLIGLDISQSMLAQDITPNRLDRAKHEISKFIDLLKGDRVGLIVFAGESFVQCPLTLDYGAAKMFLDAVSENWISLQGTALGDCIKQATEAFRSKVRKHKVLVLLSDGEDHEGSALEAAKLAANEGVTIYTVGIGSENGVPIPVNQGGGAVVYKKDREGNLVMTRLNSMILEKIAFEGKGKYFHAGTDLDLTRIYSEIARMEKKDLGSTHATMYEERYQIFLFLAILFLLAEFFIPERVNRVTAWKGRFE